ARHISSRCITPLAPREVAAGDRAVGSGPSEHEPHDRTCMPRAKTPAIRKPSPYERAGSAELNAMVERVAPAILALLADGVPRTKPTIVATLADRHAAEDVALALVRLAVTEQVVETNGRYTLGDDGPPEAA